MRRRIPTEGEPADLTVLISVKRGRGLGQYQARRRSTRDSTRPAGQKAGRQVERLEKNLKAWVYLIYPVNSKTIFPPVTSSIVMFSSIKVTKVCHGELFYALLYLNVYKRTSDNATSYCNIKRKLQVGLGKEQDKQSIQAGPQFKIQMMQS